MNEIFKFSKVMDDPASIFFMFFAAEPGAVPEPATLASTIFNIFLVIFLVLANGFFVASEFSLVAVRKSRIESLANEGNKGAKRLFEMLNNLNAYSPPRSLALLWLRSVWAGSANRRSPRF
jgi:hypothetical protein